jgi:hypothetical protein
MSGIDNTAHRPEEKNAVKMLKELKRIISHCGFWNEVEKKKKKRLLEGPLKA